MLISDGLEILDEDECMALLASTTVGRIGVTMGALPAIFVVNYLIDDSGAIVFRTNEGTKLTAALQHAVVAFEADLTDPVHRQGWTVQIVGVAEEFTPEDGFRGPTPWAPGVRDHFVRVRPQFVSGRRIPRASALEYS